LTNCIAIAYNIARLNACILTPLKGYLRLKIGGLKKAGILLPYKKSLKKAGYLRLIKRGPKKRV